MGKVDRLLVGALCDHEWIAIADKLAIERHHANIDPIQLEKIREAREKLALVPLLDRPLVLQRSSFQKLPYLRDLWGTTENAARALHSLKWDLLNGRQRFISRKTPQGLREALLARIARDEGKRRNVLLTARQVERCWDEYRAFIKAHR